MNNEKISIILPTYNPSLYIKESVESVLRQNYKNFELLIINDGSNNQKSLRLIGELTNLDKRIRIINNKTNLGLQCSLNIGLKKSTGDYIARIDDDDLWISPEKLQKQLNFLKNNPSYVLVGTFADYIDNKNKIIEKIFLFSEDSKIRNKILLACPFIHSSVMFQKSSLAKTGNYNTALTLSEDLDLWCRFGQIGKLYNIPKSMVGFRLRSGQISYNFRSKRRKKQLQETLTIIKKYRKYYPQFTKAYIKNLFELIFNYLPLPRGAEKYIIQKVRKLRTKKDSEKISARVRNKNQS